MKHIHRRDMLRGAGVSALAGIGPATASALPIEPKGGELAALIRLYWQQIDYFNDMEHTVTSIAMQSPPLHTRRPCG